MLPPDATQGSAGRIKGLLGRLGRVRCRVGTGLSRASFGSHLTLHEGDPVSARPFPPAPFHLASDDVLL